VGGGYVGCVWPEREVYTTLSVDRRAVRRSGRRAGALAALVQAANRHRRLDVHRSVPARPVHGAGQSESGVV